MARLHALVKVKPAVGLCIQDEATQADVFYMLRSMGIMPLLLEHSDSQRWDLLVRAVGRKPVVCIIDDDPEMIVAATALGIDAVIYSQPDNLGFPWHLRALDLADARQGIDYRLKIWKDTAA